MAEEMIEATATVQTTDATWTLLASYTVPDDHSSGMGMIQFIAQKKATGTGKFGGWAIATFRRTTTGNVSITTVDQKRNAGPGGDFRCTVSGNDIQFEVEGRNSETWEWAGWCKLYNE